MSKKKIAFKERHRLGWDNVARKFISGWKALIPGGEFSSCCGATFVEELSSSKNSYGTNMSGRGIALFAGHEPKPLKLKQERQYNINTVNGPISFIIRHNKEPKNDD